MNKTLLLPPKIRDFFKKNFSKKQILIKSIILISTLAIVLIMSLSFYFWLRDEKVGTEKFKNGFWYIKIVHNDGIGFGGFKNNLVAINLIQSMMFIFLFLIFVFTYQNILATTFISLAMFGGIFNILQRANDHGWVLDYFQFGFWESFPTFNWPDIFVVISIFSSIIITFVTSGMQFINEKKKSKTHTPDTSSIDIDKQKTIIDY